MIRNSWSQLAFELIETLTCKIRALTQQQLVHGWRAITSEQFNLTIESLRRADLLLVERRTIPEIPFTGVPIHYWSPGDPNPNMKELAKVVDQRWKTIQTTQNVLTATRRATRLFGAARDSMSPSHHLNHDLLLAEVFVNYRSMIPSVANSWIGRDAATAVGKRGKTPDAFLVDGNEMVVRVVKSAGRFKHRQLKSFHEHCSVNQTAYELW